MFCISTTTIYYREVLVMCKDWQSGITKFQNIVSTFKRIFKADIIWPSSNLSYLPCKGGLLIRMKLYHSCNKLGSVKEVNNLRGKPSPNFTGITIARKITYCYSLDSLYSVWHIFVESIFKFLYRDSSTIYEIKSCSVIQRIVCRHITS